MVLNFQCANGAQINGEWLTLIESFEWLLLTSGDRWVVTIIANLAIVINECRLCFNYCIVTTLLVSFYLVAS